MKIIKKLAAALAVGAASAMLGGCATGVPAEVTRYSAMPIPQGQTFYIVQANGMPAGLEFSRFAGQAAQHLQARGYRQAASVQTADMIVRLGYQIDETRMQPQYDPYGMSPYGDPYYRGYGYPYGGYAGYDRYGAYLPYGGYGYGYGYGGHRQPYYSRYGYWGPRSPFYYGWNDPFIYGPAGMGYRHGLGDYRVFESELSMNIIRRTDNAPLFEGRAQARSQTDNPGVLVPNLIEAMFTGFPGRNGETIRITVPAAPRG